MDVAALIVWVVTALGGFGLIGLWISKGGLRQQESGETRFPTPLVLAHFLLAAVGLVVWLGFVISDETTGLAWTGLGLLAVVALLGFALLWRWWQGRQAVQDADGPVPAEQHFPLPLVVAHGAAAVTTVVLVVLAAVAAAD